MRTTRQRIYSIVLGGLIAALYAAATYAAATLNLVYGPFQFRISEALTILPVFTPASIPGLTIGCFIANLGSPYGWMDYIVGTFATLIAAILTRKLRKVEWRGVPILAPLAPVIANAVIVGFTIAYSSGSLNMVGFLGAAGLVGFGELVVCYGLGLPLWALVKKLKLFERFTAATNK